jgi:hypothetical protein
VAEDERPAARPGVSAARAVGIELHLGHIDCFTECSRRSGDRSFGEPNSVHKTRYLIDVDKIRNGRCFPKKTGNILSSANGRKCTNSCSIPAAR